MTFPLYLNVMSVICCDECDSAIIMSRGTTLNGTPSILPGCDCLMQYIITILTSKGKYPFNLDECLIINVWLCGYFDIIIYLEKKDVRVRTSLIELSEFHIDWYLHKVATFLFWGGNMG